MDSQSPCPCRPGAPVVRLPQGGDRTREGTRETRPRASQTPHEGRMRVRRGGDDPSGLGTEEQRSRLLQDNRGTRRRPPSR
eukprot:996391-Pyramimonas_sp.AAC.1